MPKYRYRALDAEDKPIFGELDAPGVDEVLRQLAAQGLRAETGDVWEPHAPLAAEERLNEEQAAELAARVAELARAGLPLGPGLRALAGELQSRKVSRLLVRVARELDAGRSLEDALALSGGRFPAHLRGLMLAGVKIGRLPEMLEEHVAFQRDRANLKRHIWTSMAYPTLLLTIALVLFLFLNVFILPQFVEIYEDFGLELPLLTQLVLATSLPGVRVLACLPAFALYLLLLLATTRVPVWGRRLFYHVPFLGPLWRLHGMVCLSRLLGLLVEEEMPLPDALVLAADGLAEPDLAVACRRAARQVRGGQPLGEALARHWQFLPTLRAFAEWGQQSACLAEALRSAGEVFERRLRVQLRLCDVVVPALVFLMVIAAAVLIIAALFLPLFSIITKLAG